MDELSKTLSQHLSEIVLLAAVLHLLVIVGLLRLASQNRRHRKRWSTLLDGTRGDNLERLLYDHLAERVELERKLQEAVERIDVLEAKMATAKRHLGIVRFDAFEDVGGAQSFAMALYDDKGNGSVLNGLVGRNDVRIYCKPLVEGRADRNLSQEEVRAIEEARADGPRSVVSP